MIYSDYVFYSPLPEVDLSPIFEKYDFMQLPVEYRQDFFLAVVAGVSAGYIAGKRTERAKRKASAN